jgi:hypothetical protein
MARAADGLLEHAPLFSRVVLTNDLPGDGV